MIEYPAKYRNVDMLEKVANIIDSTYKIIVSPEWPLSSI
jgi:hypothetical protein